MSAVYKTLSALERARKYGASSGMLSGGRAATRSASKTMPHGVDLPGFHWSNTDRLLETDPAYYGRGIKGAEADRLAVAPDVKPRTYFYTNEKAREPGLGSNQYKADLQNVYPKTDPLGLMAKSKGDPTDFERRVKNHGYKGYEGGDAVVYFDRARVSPHQAGTLPAPAREAGPTITDATEVQVGSELGTPRLSPELEEKRMAWLERSNKAYEKLGLNPQSRVSTGSYTPEGGETEFNRVLSTDIPWSPEAEQAVDMYSTFRNVMLGQNARGGVGVAPYRTGEEALRLNFGPSDMGKIPQVMADTEKAGMFAVPTSEGVSIIGGATDPDELYKFGHGLMQQHNVTRPMAFQGGQTSLYHPYPWATENGAYKGGQGIVTQTELIPRIEGNRELAKRIELTGELPQLARGVLATESDAALGSLSQAGSLPEDVVNLNRILSQGGLAALEEWVKKHGYAGLPAGFAATLPPTDNQGR